MLLYCCGATEEEVEEDHSCCYSAVKMEMDHGLWSRGVYCGGGQRSRGDGRGQTGEEGEEPRLLWRRKDGCRLVDQVKNAEVADGGGGRRGREKKLASVEDQQPERRRGGVEVRSSTCCSGGAGGARGKGAGKRRSTCSLKKMVALRRSVGGGCGQVGESSEGRWRYRYEERGVQRRTGNCEKGPRRRIAEMALGGGGGAPTWRICWRNGAWEGEMAAHGCCKEKRPACCGFEKGR